MPMLLAGSMRPIGEGAQFVEAPCDAVLDALACWRRGLGNRLRVGRPLPIEQALVRLTPFEAPWTRELLAPCGDRWTLYLNNFVDGGDTSASIGVIADALGVRHVVAMHSPLEEPDGHASTQLWLLGPTGVPPLMYVRTVVAYCEDGRWTWETDGEVQPFERVERYGARRIRDRLDRALLVEYLGALGIPLDDDDAYGPGVVVQQKVPWKRRTVPLDEARRELGLPPLTRRRPWRR